MTRMPPPSLIPQKQIFSVKHIAIANSRVYFFITSSLLFSLSFTHFSSLSTIFLASVLLEGHLFAHGVINPSMPGCCPTLAMCVWFFFVLFSTCCLLFCRTVITFSFYSIYREDVRVDGVDAKTNMHFERDDTQPHSNTDIAYCSHRLTKLSVFSWGLHIYAHKSRISWIGNAYSTILWKLWKTSVCVCRHIPKQRSVIYKDKWMSNVCCCRKLRW